MTVFCGIGNCCVKKKKPFPYAPRQLCEMKQIEQQHQELIAQCQYIAISFINDTFIKCAFHENKDM